MSFPENIPGWGVYSWFRSADAGRRKASPCNLANERESGRDRECSCACKRESTRDEHAALFVYLLCCTKPGRSDVPPYARKHASLPRGLKHNKQHMGRRDIAPFCMVRYALRNRDGSNAAPRVYTGERCAAFDIDGSSSREQKNMFRFVQNTSCCEMYNNQTSALRTHQIKVMLY